MEMFIIGQHASGQEDLRSTQLYITSESLKSKDIDATFSQFPVVC